MNLASGRQGRGGAADCHSPAARRTHLASQHDNTCDKQRHVCLPKCTPVMPQCTPPGGHWLAGTDGSCTWSGRGGEVLPLTHTLICMSCPQSAADCDGQLPGGTCVGSVGGTWVFGRRMLELPGKRKTKEEVDGLGCGDIQAVGITGRCRGQGEIESLDLLWPLEWEQ